MGLSIQGWESDREEADGVYNIPEEEVPIPDFIGLAREDWCKKEVTLVNDTGVAVATAYVEFAKEWQAIDGRSPLGKDYVGIVVCKVLDTRSSLACRTLQRWPMQNTMYEGVSLYNHERQCSDMLKAKDARRGTSGGSRQYLSERQARIPRPLKRKDTLLLKNSIQETLRSSCCKRRCIGQFSFAEVETLRYEMHHSDTTAKDSMRLAIHKNFHYVPGSVKQVCVIEGKVVCMTAWRMLYGVSKTDFYRYRAYAESGRRAQPHAGKGRKRISKSKTQAVQTMSMILTTTADSMPHRTRTIATGALKGQKVVQKVLPAGTKWKSILQEVNKVNILKECFDSRKCKHCSAWSI